MSQEPPSAMSDPQEEIAKLVRTLHETQQRLQELAGGEVDAVVHSGGQSYLLHEAQEKLRESETAQRDFAAIQSSILNALPAHIALLDHTGRILSVNEGWRHFARTNGLRSATSCVGENYLEVCEQAQGECAVEALDAAAGIRAVLSGASENFSLDYPCHAPTEERWFRLRVDPLEDGGPRGAVVMHVDITESKLAEEAVRQQEALTRIAGRVTRTGGWAVEKRKLRVFWSDEVFNILEFPRGQEPTLAEALALYPEPWRDRITAAIVASAREGTPFDMEAEILTARQRRIWVRVCGEAETHADGSIKRVQGAFQDITEHKLAEREVQFNEQRYRSLVEATTAIVWDTPASGEFEVEQPGWSAFTGQSFEELRGWGWLQAIHPEDREETARVWSVAVANRTNYVVEHRLRARDQTYRNMAVRGVPILGEDGNIRQWIGIHADITHSKKLEQQFFRAQRMDSIGTLAGGIAHDLNNMLAPIIMSIELLRLDETDEQRLSILSMIDSSAKRGADMVRKMLLFGRGVEGRRVRVSIPELVSDVEKIANDTFLKHLRVQTRVPRGLWTVIGDPTQLHQDLLNLAVNARDAMPDGGTLTLSAENLVIDSHYTALNPEAETGHYIVLQVEDTGTGMEPEVIELIFDPFFTTKELGNGTGLGLSTSLAIMKSHGGFVRVESELGRGTKFRVYLPADTTHAVTDEVIEEVELPRGAGELILVVDDEALVREITQQTLQAFGYRVLLASDGVDAVAAYVRQGAEIAVVLTDMMMPVMDGPATIKVLRKLNARLPIIAVSGLPAKDPVAQSTIPGVQYFLAKPYTVEALLKVLRQILGKA